MPNPWKQFKDLLPDSPLLIGEVLSHNPDGTSTVQLIDGGILRARGQSVAIGHNAFIRGGVIEGEAPDLPGQTIEI
jgi:hypothetical protein